MIVYNPDEEQLERLCSLSSTEFRAFRLVIRIRSELLGTEIYLVSDPSLAKEVHGVVYTPEEIGELMKIRRALKLHYPERLRKIHDTKRIFKGRIVSTDFEQKGGKRDV